MQRLCLLGVYEISSLASPERAAHAYILPAHTVKPGQILHPPTKA
jgi:hypothetical protein